jgi:hypothetical protein
LRHGNREGCCSAGKLLLIDVIHPTAHRRILPPGQDR